MSDAQSTLSGASILNAQNGRGIPPIPADLAAREIPLTENARTVLKKRYLRKGPDGKPAETIPEMFWRVAWHVAQPDADAGADAHATARRFYDLLTNLTFMPNSPTFTGAGTPLGQLAACFVLAIEDDMGKIEGGIFDTLRDAVLIQQTGGGNGFSFSRLRPRGAVVRTSMGVATGPVGFLRVYDKAFGEVSQGGSRRGANMAVLRVDHPDIREFIRSKAKEGEIANFNISVGITDEFMQAVEKGTTFDLRFGGEVHETVDARELFNEIVRYAHHNGEPGVLFLDAANRSNPVPHLYELEATNPCVTGDTLVATPRGWRRVDSIREGDEICTVLGTGRVATVEVNHDVPVYRVYLSDGAVVRATAAHQFHVRDSRRKFFEPRRLDELKAGDWVRVYRTTLPNNPVPPTSADLSDREYGFLVGVLVGDGGYTPHALSKKVVRLSTHADDDEWNNVLREAFAKVGVETMYTYLNEGSRSMMMDPKPGRVIADWVNTLPLEAVRGPEKRLPDEYINSNPGFLTGLLDGLFSTDGSVDLQSNHPLLRFHTSSRELARQVRLILLMFGVHGRVIESRRKRHDLNGRVIRDDRPKYDVVISGQSLGRFFEQISLSHPHKRMRLEEAALLSNFTGGNWAARVVKIEPAGIETVYDLYEPRSDTWITEGYVSRGCGEQWLGPYENCCLGSVNLNRHVSDDGVIDWEALAASVRTSTHFLDNVVSANAYVPAVPELEEAAHRARRIGLGIMGLGDVMFKLGVRYGSVEGQELAAQLMEFVRYHCMQRSIELAQERGPFLAIDGSIYDPANLKWRPPTPLFAYEHDWRRPPIDWSTIVEGIKRHGIRNAAQTTVAPTGTISTVAGVEGYGCEPVFALAYLRWVQDGDNRLQLTYTSPLFEKALTRAGLDEASRQQISEKVSLTGSCQELTELPEHIRHTFVVAGDITPEEHVRMQAAIQSFVDNSLSKTVNFPAGATVEDVATAYQLAWKLGCKGITVYVTGTRETVVLETKGTAQAKQEGAPAEAAATKPATAPARAEYHDGKKPRPRRMPGATYFTRTPLGKAYITVNRNGNNEPFEVFASVGKAGSDTAAVSEAIGRLISLVLRLPSSLSPTERLEEVVEQLAGIGGGRHLGFGANRILSLPDAIAQVLHEDLQFHQETAETTPEQVESQARQLDLLSGTLNADLCPECGHASLVNEEGCRKCYSCAYSEC